MLIGKCLESTCSSLSSCMTDPTSAACTAAYGGAAAIPSVLAGDLFTQGWTNWKDKSLGKCSEVTCSSLVSCMTDPTASTCTAAYGGAASLPSVLAGDRLRSIQQI